MSSLTNYHTGVAAEDIVALNYARRGYQAGPQRWRGSGGEIDLIMRKDDAVIFVEVKKSKTFAQAAARLTRKQMDRIYASASEFIGHEPAGQLTDVRFDLAMVDGRGDVRIIENAFMDVA